MNQKDWILLIVPIISNGIIVFILQSVFQRYNKKIMDKYEKERNLHNTFYEMLLSAKNEYRNLGYSIVQAPDNTEQIMNNLTTYNREIRRILDYFDDHTSYFKKNEPKISALREYYDRYVSYFSKKIQLDDTDRNRMSKDLNQINKYIEELLKLF